jgi:hypothetical protein
MSNRNNNNKVGNNGGGDRHYFPKRGPHGISKASAAMTTSFQQMGKSTTTVSHSDLISKDGRCGEADQTTTAGGNESTPQMKGFVSYSTLKQNMTVTTDSAKGDDLNQNDLRVLQAQFALAGMSESSERSEPNILEDNDREESELNSV